MSTEAKESVELGTAVAVSAAFSEEQACEHPGHAGTVLGTHGGAGEWYVNVHCPDCDSRRVYVLCGPFKRHAQETDMDVWCMECYATMPVSSIVVNFVPIRTGL